MEEDRHRPDTCNEVERSLGQKSARINNENMLYAWQNDGSEHLFTFPNHVFPYTATWTVTARYTPTGSKRVGQKARETAGRARRPQDDLRAISERRSACPRRSRSSLAKEIWAIAADQVYTIGVIGLAAAVGGVRIFRRATWARIGPGVQQPGRRARRGAICADP